MTPGVKLNLRGTEYEAPPLTLRAIRDLTAQGVMEGVTASFTLRASPEEMVKQVGAIAKIVHASLVVNYKHLTPEAVEELLDMGNMNEVLNAVLGISGLVRKPGEGASPEAKSPSLQ